jgi:ribonuclease HI
MSGTGYFLPTTKETFLIPGNSKSSMDSELLGIDTALGYCLTTSEKEICIFIYSQAALLLLQRYEPTKYYFRTIQIFQLLQKFSAQQKIIQFQWIPSHVNIDSNERVDEIAKIATMLQPTLQPVMSLEVNVSALNKIIAQIWKNRVSDSSVGNSYKLNAKHIYVPMYKKISRALQTFSARARLGHILTRSYLYKFGLRLTPMCRLCQKPDENLQHILKDCTMEFPGVKRMDNYDMEVILNNSNLWKLAQHIYWRHRAISSKAGCI